MSSHYTFQLILPFCFGSKYLEELLIHDIILFVPRSCDTFFPAPKFMLLHAAVRIFQFVYLPEIFFHDVFGLQYFSNLHAVMALFCVSHFNHTLF